jgi:hypothetical protein
MGRNAGQSGVFARAAASRSEANALLQLFVYASDLSENRYPLLGPMRQTARTSCTSGMKWRKRFSMP